MEDSVYYHSIVLNGEKMNLTNYMVTSLEIEQNQVQSAPDDLTGMSALSVKQVFDKLPKMNVQRYNGLIEAMGARMVFTLRQRLTPQYRAGSHKLV